MLGRFARVVNWVCSGLAILLICLTCLTVYAYPSEREVLVWGFLFAVGVFSSAALSFYIVEGPSSNKDEQ